MQPTKRPAKTQTSPKRSTIRPTDRHNNKLTKNGLGRLTGFTHESYILLFFLFVSTSTTATETANAVNRGKIVDNGNSGIEDPAVNTIDT